MLRDANPRSFHAIYLICGFTDMRYGMDTLAAITLGRKNWVNMYSTRGAQSSAVLYSLVETAKANSLNVYEYFDYLLTELSAHADDPDPSFVEELLPWTKTTQEKCRSRKKA